jgi:cobalt-zinc-cadmium efflux system membrane fusion protein
MTTKASRWKKGALVATIVAAPLLVHLPAALRGKPAVAQETPKPAPEKLGPREAALTAEQEKALGLRVVPASRVRGDHKLVTGGKVSLDIEHTARVRPLLNSTIYEVTKHAGEQVVKGEDLMVVEATDLGDAKNAYLSAVANLELAAETYRREGLLRAKHATTDTDYFNARAAFRTALVSAQATREKCLLFGVRSQELAELEAELRFAVPNGAPPASDEPDGLALALKPPSDGELIEDARRTLREVAQRRQVRPAPEEADLRRRARYTIRAPIGGVLITKDAARGELVDPSQVIATVSDVSTLWINLDIYQNDIAQVRIGARVDITTPTYPDVAFVGSVTFMSEVVDDTTHTLKARVVVDNEKRLLKSGMAAKTVIHCIDDAPKIELRPEAILHEGQDTFVIVKKGPGKYERRSVKLGLEAQDAVHVESGVAEGELVVESGNLFIHTTIPLGD